LPGKVKNNLLWSPSNSGPLACKNQVLTIHDLVSIDHPEWFNKSYVKWYDYMLPRLVKNVQHIIAISEFTRSRILEVFKVPDSKVTLIYNGADTEPSIPDKNSTPMTLPFERYVLSLGSPEPRKNITLLLNAWKNILYKIPEDIGLVVVGGIGNNKNI